MKFDVAFLFSLRISIALMGHKQLTYRQIKHYDIWDQSNDRIKCRFFDLIEPQHDKSNKMTCAASDDSDQPGPQPSLIRAFAVRMLGSLATH